MHSTLLQHRYLASAAARWAAPVLLAAGATAAPAAAAVVVDQSALVVPTLATPVAVVARIGEPPAGRVGTNLFAAQSMTAGQSGFLDRIEFQLASAGPANGFLNLALIDGDFVAGARDVFAFAAVPIAFLPTLTQALNGSALFTFDVSGSAFRVAPGQIFSVVFQVTAFEPNAAVLGLIGTGSPFMPGVTPTFAYNNPPGAVLTGYANGDQGPAFTFSGDIGFRSYVDLAAVPEPESWAMMIAGFGLIGAVMRRRRVAEGAGGAEAGARA